METRDGEDPAGSLHQHSAGRVYLPGPRIQQRRCLEREGSLISLLSAAALLRNLLVLLFVRGGNGACWSGSLQAACEADAQARSRPATARRRAHAAAGGSEQKTPATVIHGRSDGNHQPQVF